LRWSWHRPTRELFAGLNPRLWVESGEDPVGFLGLVSREEFQQLAADQSVVDRVRAAEKDLDRYLEEPRWYQSRIVPELDKPLKKLTQPCPW
jgi:starch phosphorylase